MKIRLLVLLIVVGLVLGFETSRSAEPIPNRLIDYAGFQRIVDTAEKERESHRLTELAFLEMMGQKDVVILDARSTTMYRLRHIKGAVNLQFTDFTAAALTSVLPDKDVRILIYCNNNFLGAPVAFASKMATASLNLSTYTSLKSYGYNQIYELGPLLNVKTTTIPFEGSDVAAEADRNSAAEIVAGNLNAERCAN